MPKQPKAPTQTDKIALPNKDALSYLGLYRAGMSTPAHRQHVTVARQPMVQDAIDHLRRSMNRKSKHHFMFIGPRGSGKTHILSLIEDEIARQPDLAAHFVVARFPEESNRILSFADFLLGLVEILADELPDEPDWRTCLQRLESEEDNSIIVDTLVPLIRKQNRDRGRTVLVMLENLHETLTRQIRDRREVGAFRKFLMDDNGCQLIGTAPMHFDAITSVDEPFFDFFDVQVLDLLDKEESIELIRRNLEWEDRQHLLQDFATLRPKLMALHDMTGGSPRLTLMLYELIVHDSVVEVRQQFMKLLDKITPFYQDRLRDLAPLERAVLENIALMRDSDQPKTPARIAARMRISQQQVSSLLKRMTDSRYLKSEQHPTDKRSRLYSIREGFFDIWLAMNLSRKHRRRLPILVDCLAQFYPQWEEREKKRREYREKWGDVNSREGMDLLSEIGPVEERVQAKLELAKRFAGEGNVDSQQEYMSEIRSLPLDTMGQWIVRSADERLESTNYLDEIQEMITCWSLHRSGDIEGFGERLSQLGNELTFRNFSETKLAFLREHLQLVTGHLDRILLRNRIGNLLCELARWQEAEQELRAAIEEAERIADHDLISTSLNNLALLLLATDRLGEAEPLMRRALLMCEQSLNHHLPKIAILKSNLASLLHDTNRLSEAEPLMRRALAMEEQLFGPSHPNVATDLNNLAQLLLATNRLEEAEPLMRRALAIDEQSFGNDTPKVAIDLNNLAMLLQATNRLEEAENLMSRAFAIDERSFGTDHPSVANRLSNLAQLLLATNRLEKAEPLMRRALAIDEQSFGIHHPSVARDLNNLALLLQETNRLEEAEPLMRRALAIDEQSFGTDHPDVAVDLCSLAQLLQATNRLVEAEPLMSRHLAIFCQFTRQTGHRHPHLVKAIDNYWTLLEAMQVPKPERLQRLVAAGVDPQWISEA